MNGINFVMKGKDGLFYPVKWKTVQIAPVRGNTSTFQHITDHFYMPEPDETKPPVPSEDIDNSDAVPSI